MKIIKIYFLLSLFTASIFAQDKYSAIDQYLAGKYPMSEPGAAVLVVKDGKTILRKGYGMASIDPQRVITPDMIFRIGSITKQFTSSAILKLAEEKKLDLNADITTYLPSFNSANQKITVEHLLNHTSGIKSYTSLSEIMSTEGKAKKMTVVEMLEIIQKQPHDFAPGEQSLYNNSGYFLLGAIIEKVSGMTYEDYVTKHFFKPLKMNSTFCTDTKLPSNTAIGYRKAAANEFLVADYVHPSIPYSAGAIFSTIDDLWKWNQAIFSGKIIKPESLERAWAPTKLNDGTLISYGYGWSLNRIGDRKVIGHGGGIDGFLTFEMYLPENHVYVCILQNSLTGSPGEYAYEIASIVMNIKSEAPVAISIDENNLDDYVGVYQINKNEERIITRSAGQMFSQRTGGNKSEIYPYDTDTFAFKDSPSRIKFIRDANGKVVEAEITGRDWINQRSVKTDKPIPALPVAIEIDPSAFDVFAGEYELAPGFIIKVWREDKSFKAQATGQPAFDIYPETENKYFLKVVDAKIAFNKDDQGNVTTLTLYQGGREIPGKKIK